eukprot:9491791-Pyramimonas_sp.AAC.2
MAGIHTIQRSREALSTTRLQTSARAYRLAYPVDSCEVDMCARACASRLVHTYNSDISSITHSCVYGGDTIRRSRADTRANTTDEQLRARSSKKLAQKLVTIPYPYHPRNNRLYKYK